MVKIISKSIIRNKKKGDKIMFRKFFHAGMALAASIIGFAVIMGSVMQTSSPAAAMKKATETPIATVSAQPTDYQETGPCKYDHTGCSLYTQKEHPCEMFKWFKTGKPGEGWVLASDYCTVSTETSVPTSTNVPSTATSVPSTSTSVPTSTWVPEKTGTPIPTLIQTSPVPTQPQSTEVTPSIPPGTPSTPTTPVPTKSTPVVPPTSTPVTPVPPATRTPTTPTVPTPVTTITTELTSTETIITVTQVVTVEVAAKWECTENCCDCICT
jgi:hypothetical protein